MTVARPAFALLGKVISRIRQILAAMRWPRCKKCGIGRMAVIWYCECGVDMIPGRREHIHQKCSACGYFTTRRCADAAPLLRMVK